MERVLEHSKGRTVDSTVAALFLYRSSPGLFFFTVTLYKVLGNAPLTKTVLHSYSRHTHTHTHREIDRLFQ